MDPSELPRKPAHHRSPGESRSGGCGFRVSPCVRKAPVFRQSYVSFDTRREAYLNPEFLRVFLCIRPGIANLFEPVEDIANVEPFRRELCIVQFVPRQRRGHRSAVTRSHRVGRRGGLSIGVARYIHKNPSFSLVLSYVGSQMAGIALDKLLGDLAAESAHF